MNRRGISPVIATVIIVAVAIAIAIAVAFWMTGIVGIFTGQVEQLQIVAATPSSGSSSGYKIEVIVKNAGTTAVTIDGVFITPSDLVVSGTTTISCTVEGTSKTIGTDALNGIDTDSECKLDAGDSGKIVIDNLSGTAGQSVEVKLHTAAGKEYPKLLVLP